MIIKNIGYALIENGIIKDAGIYIEKNEIVDIGSSNEILERYDSEIIDAKGMAAMPGIINMHTHAAMTLLRGYADDMELMEWLTEKIWPIEAKLKQEHCYAGSLLACLEMIRSGTTCFADMYFHLEQTAKSVEESGIRGLISGVCFDAVESCRTEQAENFLKTVHRSERIIPMICPHSAYACSEDMLKRIKELSLKYDARIHTHISESMQEVRNIKKQKGMTPVEYLNSPGLYDSFILAHVIWPTEKEFSMLRNSMISHCPVSNMKMACGCVPIWKFLENKWIEFSFCDFTGAKFIKAELKWGSMNNAIVKNSGFSSTKIEQFSFFGTPIDAANTTNCTMIHCFKAESEITVKDMEKMAADMKSVNFSQNAVSHLQFIVQKAKKILEEKGKVEFGFKPMGGYFVKDSDDKYVSVREYVKKGNDPYKSANKKIGGYGKG